jgi:cytochrome c oxidase subunit 4
MDHGSVHVMPRRVYYAVFAALIAMTLVTVWVAYFDLGALNAVVALTIACFKATLVMLYFMHLRYSSSLIWIAVGAGVAWLLLLVAITMSDYMSRGWLGPAGA